MSRQGANIPIAFANAPAPPASEPTVNLDTDFGYLLGLIQDSANGFVNSAADTGIANAYAVTLNATIAPSGYANGMAVAFLVSNTNTGASTLNVNSLGTVPILNAAGNALGANNLVAGDIAFVIYYSGNFYLPTAPTDGVFTASPTGGPQTTTFNCAGFSRVSIMYNAQGANSNATLTINVTGVSYGAHFDVMILSNGSVQAFKWTGTDQAGNTITPIIAYYPQGVVTPSAPVNLITNGDSTVLFITYQGCAFNYGVGTTTLRFIGAIHN